MKIEPHRLLLGLALLIAATAQAAAGPARPCDTPGDCLPGWECYFPLYGCPQQPGYCVETLPQCDPNSGLVCGCNGKTYTSECEAEDRGQNIAHAGVCPVNCGGQTCVGNSFCELPPGTCQQGVTPECLFTHEYTRKAELSGTCVPWPATCDQVEDRVCGCNGITYLNACEAAHDLTSINREGACPGPICGPLFGPCTNPEEVCVSTCVCSGFDFAGYCEPRPTTCDNSCLPVCGCPDGWYRNRCEWLLANPTGILEAQALGACGEGWGVLFHTKTELAWGELDHLDTYNVYRAAVSGGAPPGPWDCIASGLPANPFQEIADPPSGETWAYIVTAVGAGVTEGPLGWGDNGCVERINATPCPP
jgi:hypothetical protein